jgi:hypothetical protein
LVYLNEGLIKDVWLVVKIIMVHINLRVNPHHYQQCTLTINIKKVNIYHSVVNHYMKLKKELDVYHAFNELYTNFIKYANIINLKELHPFSRKSSSEDYQWVNIT